MIGKRLTGAVSRAWSGLRPANRKWLCVTAGAVVVLMGLYLLGEARIEPVAGTALGLTFGGLAFTCMLVAAAYGLRKRWRPLVAQRSLGGKTRVLRNKRMRQARINEARRSIADLQAEVSQRILQDPAEIRRRARRVLRSVKASRMLRVELEVELGGLIRIWLIEKELPGTMENWLLVHSYVGFLAVLLVALHSGFRFGGVVASVGAILAGIVGVSGLVGAVLYVAIPRALGRIKNPMLPPEIQAKIKEVERVMADILKDKSGPFQEMFLYPESDLAAEDMSKVEDEEKEHFRQLLELQAQKRSLEVYMARHLRYERYLRGWLYIHVPTATFLLTVVLIHIWSILYY